MAYQYTGLNIWKNLEAVLKFRSVGHVRQRQGKLVDLKGQGPAAANFCFPFFQEQNGLSRNPAGFQPAKNDKNSSNIIKH